MVITYCPQPHTKCSVRYKKKISNKLHYGALTIITFWVIFAGIGLKLEKVGQTFSSSNQCPPLPSVATDDRKEFQCLNIVSNNKTEPLLLGFN